jgi:hypothetical protein
MTRSADLQPGEVVLQTGLVTLRGSHLVTLRGSQLVKRTSASAAERLIRPCRGARLRATMRPCEWLDSASTGRSEALGDVGSSMLLVRGGLSGVKAASARGTGGLADLDQVAVGIPDVAADLSTPVLRFGEELRAGLPPLPICLVEVRDPHVQERAGPRRI